VEVLKKLGIDCGVEPGAATTRNDYMEVNKITENILPGEETGSRYR